MSENMNEKWYHRAGNTDGIVVSTRIRLARNLRDFPFPHKMTAAQKSELCSRVRDALIKGNSAIAGDFDYLEMEKVDAVKAQSLVEKHLISPEFAEHRKGRALLLKKDESVSIMLCEEDHIRIQVMSAGLALSESLDMADKIDTLLDSELGFAFDEKLGYLTCCPTNLGTGMRASVMLHLPALEAAGGIQQLSGAVSKIGLTLRGTFGEGSRAAGALYQLSNQITLGISEKDALDNLSAITNQVIARENEVRGSIDKNALADKVFRSLGIMKYARSLNSKELNGHISDLRLGASAGILKDLPLSLINTVGTDMQPACIAAAAGKAVSPAERDRIRAEKVRELLKNAGNE